MLVQVVLVVNKRFLEQASNATFGNKRGAFRMLNLCFQNTCQMKLWWRIIDLEAF